MSKTYHIHCLSTALSPLTHMSGTQGNEAMLAREPVMTRDGVRYLPCLSGNAIRHRLIRGPGADFLIERWGLAGLLSDRQLYFLKNGGTRPQGDVDRDDLRLTADLHRIMPLYRLVGGAIPGAILPGSLIADRGILVCRENLSRLRAVGPHGMEWSDQLRPAEAFVESWQYTRSSSRNRDALLLDPSEPIGDSNLMIMSGQQVIAGAAMLHGFILQNVSELELGAVLMGLKAWQTNGATIGGQAAKGHGRLKTLYWSDGLTASDADAMAASYAAHVDAVRDEGVRWLERAFDRIPAGLIDAVRGVAPLGASQDDIQSATRAAYRNTARAWEYIDDAGRSDVLAGLRWPDGSAKKGKKAKAAT